MTKRRFFIQPIFAANADLFSINKESLLSIAAYFKHWQYQEVICVFGGYADNDEYWEALEQIIISCELRLTQYMRRNKIRMGSCFSAIEFIPSVSSFGTNANMHVLLWDKLIERGYPFIKKKLVHRGFSASDNVALDNTAGMTKMSEWRSVLQKYSNVELLGTINKI
jgi:hypothetical protein